MKRLSAGTALAISAFAAIRFIFHKGSEHVWENIDQYRRHTGIL